MLGRVLLALIVVAFYRPSMAQQWQEYRPPGAGYRVEFPGRPVEPHEVALPPGSRSIASAAVLLPSGAFTSSHNALDLASARRDPQEVLDSARDDASLTAMGWVRQELRLTIDGAPARRIVIDTPRNKVGLMLAVLSNGVLYQATYVGLSGTETSPDAERFIASLRLVPR